MLIISTLLAIAQAGALPDSTTTPAIQDEITVIGRKLRAWRGQLKTKAGVMRCVTKKSTGDRDIDQVGCDAMVTCLPKFENEFKAVLSTAGDKVLRNRMNADINQRLSACIKDRHDRLIETLADQRVARRL